MRIPARVRSVVVPLVLLAIASVSACGGGATAEEPPRRSLAADIHLPAETFHVRDLVPRSATLDVLLRSHGVDGQAAARVVQAVADVFDPRRLRSLQPFMLERSVRGALRLFEYEIDSESFLRVRLVDRASGEIEAKVLPIPRTLELAATAGAINNGVSSLFAAMKAAGEGEDLAVAMAGVFAGEIDFNTEVQPDDRFAVAFERFHREGRPSTYGQVIAAEWVPANGKPVRAIRFAPPGGQPAFYDEDGRSLRRFFLKSPLKFERITSGFSLRRMHPVLHRARAHRGVDYGAPTGAPVMAVASGTVVSVTSDRANGRMVRLRHASGYQTYYLHLSRFAKGLRGGQRVSQGDVIGYVGSTGLATGPHLHYGLTKNGQFVNPITEHRNMPPGDPIAPAAMAAFREARDRALAELAAAHARTGSLEATQAAVATSGPDTRN